MVCCSFWKKKNHYTTSDDIFKTISQLQQLNTLLSTNKRGTMPQKPRKTEKKRQKKRKQDYFKLQVALKNIIEIQQQNEQIASKTSNTFKKQH